MAPPARAGATMIVYGDPSYERRLPDLVTSLRAGDPDGGASGPMCLDKLRGLLIAAGQVEQGAQHAALAGQVLTRLRELTDRFADAFAVCLSGDGNVGANIAAARVLLDELASRVPETPVRVKVPEGFGFYTLYPEQYLEAAAKWFSMPGVRHGLRTVVVGVRSIGTTLSAVVRAATVRRNWQCVRLTVRPTGHPFDRQVALPDLGRLENATALVVDEGPGISGSSITAAARALLDAGVQRERISLLPGHGGEPGSAASDTTRAWFREGPRYVASLGELRWRGRSLTDVLAEQTSRLTGAPVERVDDLGGGAWRQFVYAKEGDWPAAIPALERTKYRCITR